MRLLTILIILLLPGMAFAHPGHGAQGFVEGFMHPFTGWDHCIAMLAIGLWAAMMRGRNHMIVGGGFLAGMLFGGVLGMQMQVPDVLETMIAASTMTAALVVVLALRIPLIMQLLLSTSVAILHGLAHGAELPQQSAAWSYGCGFMLATCILLASGWLAGRAIGSESRQRGLGFLLASIAGGFIVS